MKPLEHHVLPLLLLLVCGCSGVPVSKVAALHRGATKTAVARELDDRGVCSAQLIYRGSAYELVRYAVGRRGDGYLFVFRDSRLVKISPAPCFNGPQLEPNESEDAVYDRAVDYIEHSVDVLSPNDPPANPVNWDGVGLAAGWTVAMSPFLVLDIPFIPFAAADLITAHIASRNAGDLRLNDPVTTADTMLGPPPLRVWETLPRPF